MPVCIQEKDQMFDLVKTRVHALELTGARIACSLCVGLTFLLDAVSWVRSSSEEKFSDRGDFSLGVNMGSDSIPPKLF